MYALVRILLELGIENLELVVAHCELIEMDDGNEALTSFISDMRYRGVSVNFLDRGLIERTIKGGGWELIKDLTEADLKELGPIFKESA